MSMDLDFFGQDLGFFAGFGSDLDLRFCQVPDLDLDLDLQIFLATLLIFKKMWKWPTSVTAFSNVTQSSYLSSVYSVGSYLFMRFVLAVLQSTKLPAILSLRLWAI